MIVDVKMIKGDQRFCSMDSEPDELTANLRKVNSRRHSTGWFGRSARFA